MDINKATSRGTVGNVTGCRDQGLRVIYTAYSNT